jgi:hypothetical protein
VVRCFRLGIVIELQLCGNTVLFFSPRVAFTEELVTTVMGVNPACQGHIEDTGQRHVQGVGR